MPSAEFTSKKYQLVTMGQGHLCAVDVKNSIECWFSGKRDGESNLPPLGMSVRP
jgi:hypothetical protein